MSTTPDETAIALFEDIYAEVKGVRRTIRPTDRLIDDLGVDSLDVMEILIVIEEHYGVLLQESTKLRRDATVADVLAMLPRHAGNPS